MGKKANLYLLPASTFVYNDYVGMGATLENWGIGQLYKRAYSRRQAYVYYRRDIAKRLNTRFYNVDFDISDIVTMEEYSI